jgi:hypothetical protein
MYATDTERQRAHRAKVRSEWFATVPKVHTEHYTLYQGDALRIVPLLSGYDHCITDPPYEAHVHTMARRTRAVLEGRTPYAAIPFPPITERQRRLFLRLSCQWVLIFCQIEASGAYERMFGRQHYRKTCTWIKVDSAPQFTGDRPAQGTEHFVCAWMAEGRSVWNAGGKRGIYTHRVRDGQPRLHATQKPLGLMRELIQDFTQQGDVVLDPFMGSGTTGVACLDLGRRFMGIEQDPATFHTACQRLAQSAAQGRLFTESRPATQARLF